MLIRRESSFNYLLLVVVIHYTPGASRTHRGPFCLDSLLLSVHEFHLDLLNLFLCLPYLPLNLDTAHYDACLLSVYWTLGSRNSLYTSCTPSRGTSFLSLNYSSPIFRPSNRRTGVRVMFSNRSTENSCGLFIFVPNFLTETFLCLSSLSSCCKECSRFLSRILNPYLETCVYVVLRVFRSSMIFLLLRGKSILYRPLVFRNILRGSLALIFYLDADIVFLTQDLAFLYAKVMALSMLSLTLDVCLRIESRIASIFIALLSIPSLSCVVAILSGLSFVPARV
uniref:Secreted protein n=1 Tax=Heterorhabditis bacteriophora TaxID=37862 RepID=A0A1I7WI97_HETBA